MVKLVIMLDAGRGVLPEILVYNDCQYHALRSPVSEDYWVKHYQGYKPSKYRAYGGLFKEFQTGAKPRIRIRNQCVAGSDS